MEKDILVILGASSNKERYSNRAVRMASEHQLQVVPVSLKEEVIEGLKAYRDLPSVKKAFPKGVDTLSVYLSKDKALAVIDEIVELNPRRIILNPGADEPEVSQALEQKGIGNRVQHACTLVLLSTGQY